jgi:hypothetical protein
MSYTAFYNWTWTAQAWLLDTNGQGWPSAVIAAYAGDLMRGIMSQYACNGESPGNCWLVRIDNLTQGTSTSMGVDLTAYSIRFRRAMLGALENHDLTSCDGFPSSQPVNFFNHVYQPHTVWNDYYPVIGEPFGRILPYPPACPYGSYPSVQANGYFIASLWYR